MSAALTSCSISPSSSGQSVPVSMWPMRPPTAAASSARMAFSAPVLRIALSPAGSRPVVLSERISTKRSPITAMTACAASHAVVTAPTTTMRPGPGQGLPAVGADVAFPPAVVDLAQGGQHPGAGVAVGR